MREGRGHQQGCTQWGCLLGAEIGSALTFARSTGRTNCVAILQAAAAARAEKDQAAYAAKAATADAVMALLLDEESIAASEERGAS